MKKITICLAIGLFPLAIYSQVDVGVKAGISLSNISADMVTNDYKIISTPESKMGYHFGGFVHASLFGVFIQPELLFTSIASDYIVTDLHTLEENVSDQRIGRVDVPVIIGAKLGTLRLGVGPVASFIVSNNSELEDITGYKQNLKSATFGYQLGVGLDIWKAGLDIRYEGNLSKLSDQIQVGGQPVKFDSRAKQLIFSLSFRF